VTATIDYNVRPGTRSDLGMMADNIVEGFGSYRTWAAPDWEAPTRTAMLLGMMQRFTKDGSWSVVAFTTGGNPAGHGAARPELEDDGAPRADLARLTHLFVRRDHWGSSVAGLVHDALMDEMRERGFSSSCLWTPTGAVRARAFYERNGWALSGETDPANENDLELELIEYVRELG